MAGYHFFVIHPEASLAFKEKLREQLMALPGSISISKVAPSQSIESLLGRSYYIKYENDSADQIIEILNGHREVESHLDPTKRKLSIPFMFDKPVSAGQTKVQKRC
jgi:hypothetical protein